MPEEFFLSASDGPYPAGPISGGPVSPVPISAGPVSAGPVSAGPVSGSPLAAAAAGTLAATVAAAGQRVLWSGHCAVAEYAFEEPASLPRWTLPEETEVVVTEERVVYRDQATMDTGELHWPWPQHLRVQPGNRETGRAATVTQIQLVCAGPADTFPALVFAGGDLATVGDADRFANLLRQAIARYRVENASDLGLTAPQTRMLSRLLIGPEFRNYQGGDGQTVSLLGAMPVQDEVPGAEPHTAEPYTTEPYPVAGYAEPVPPVAYPAAGYAEPVPPATYPAAGYAESVSAAPSAAPASAAPASAVPASAVPASAPPRVTSAAPYDVPASYAAAAPSHLPSGGPTPYPASSYVVPAPYVLPSVPTALAAPGPGGSPAPHPAPGSVSPAATAARPGPAAAPARLGRPTPALGDRVHPGPPASAPTGLGDRAHPGRPASAPPGLGDRAHPGRPASAYPRTMDFAQNGPNSGDARPGSGAPAGRPLPEPADLESRAADLAAQVAMLVAGGGAADRPTTPSESPTTKLSAFLNPAAEPPREEHTALREPRTSADGLSRAEAIRISTARMVGNTSRLRGGTPPQRQADGEMGATTRGRKRN